MEPVTRSAYFRRVKIDRIFYEDRSNRTTITTHFVKDTIDFSCA
ncbi:MAG: hypothetical protein BMS9Abin25_1383 [Gammaproteobacteria bacterium]|nr:MAG: hypothetical protein BMS9Abin25_1383 [Gammaproteobacteria bacterium]